jgi:hypothetical protein
MDLVRASVRCRTVNAFSVSTRCALAVFFIRRFRFPAFAALPPELFPPLSVANALHIHPAAAAVPP